MNDQSHRPEVSSDLLWYPDLGWGQWVPSTYTDDYHEAQRLRARTDFGSKLTAARADLVQAWCRPMSFDLLLDFGAANGHFVAEMNRRGIHAEAHDLRDPHPELWSQPWTIVTFFDSLEHVIDPAAHLQLARHCAIVTIPVAESREAWLASKHFKPPEHLSFWTTDGFPKWVRRFTPFRVVHHTAIEQDLGREGVATFFLVRDQNPTSHPCDI